MKRIFVITALAVFCASLTTGQLAQGTNSVTITQEEYEALVQYHADRLATTNAVDLTAGEWEVLSKHREDEAAETAKEAAEVARRKALTKWQRAKEDWKPVAWLLVVALCFCAVSFGFMLKEKWDNWRLDVWYRNYRKNNP